jgi:hypothetical protein
MSSSPDQIRTLQHFAIDPSGNFDPLLCAAANDNATVVLPAPFLPPIM